MSHLQVKFSKTEETVFGPWTYRCQNKRVAAKALEYFLSPSLTLYPSLSCQDSAGSLFHVASRAAGTECYSKVEISIKKKINSDTFYMK